MPQTSVSKAASHVFLAASILVGGCGKPESRPAAEKASQPDALILPKSEFESCAALLEHHGYDIKIYPATSGPSSGTVFLVGDLHKSEYRKNIGELLSLLLNEGRISTVGLEGLYGSRQPTIFSDRWSAIRLVVGDETADRIQRQSDDLILPIELLIQGYNAASPRKIAVFGLEERKLLILSEFLVHQEQYFSTLVQTLTALATRNPRGTFDTFVSVDTDLQQKEAPLLEMVKRVKELPDLAFIKDCDLFPKYSREMWRNPLKLAQFVSDQTQAVKLTLIDLRDRAATDIMRNEIGNSTGTFVCMGWLHAPTLLTASNQSHDVILIHPIKKGPYRTESDAQVKHSLSAHKVGFVFE